MVGHDMEIEHRFVQTVTFALGMFPVSVHRCDLHQLKLQAQPEVELTGFFLAPPISGKHFWRFMPST